MVKTRGFRKTCGDRRLDFCPLRARFELLSETAINAKRRNINFICN